MQANDRNEGLWGNKKCNSDQFLMGAQSRTPSAIRAFQLKLHGNDQNRVITKGCPSHGWSSLFQFGNPEFRQAATSPGKN